MKKGTAVTFAVGVFAGLALCGSAAQAAIFAGSVSVSVMVAPAMAMAVGPQP